MVWMSDQSLLYCPFSRIAQFERIPPVQFHKLFHRVSPVFKMLAHAEASYHTLYARFQFRHHPVIQVVPVVVRNHQASPS